MWREVGALLEVRQRKDSGRLQLAGALWGEHPQSLCVSCRLNGRFPILAGSENQLLWADIERAKRRVVSALIALGLPVFSKVTEDPAWTGIRYSAFAGGWTTRPNGT